MTETSRLPDTSILQKGGMNFDPFANFIPGRGTDAAQQEPYVTYTVREVAEMLNMCEQTIRRYVHVGEIEAWQVGQFYRIPKHGLDRFIAKSMAKTIHAIDENKRLDAIKARDSVGKVVKKKRKAAPKKRKHLEVAGLETMLRPVEICEILRIGSSQFYKMVREGLLPSCRVGNMARIKASDLKKWIDAGGTVCAKDE